MRGTLSVGGPSGGARGALLPPARRRTRLYLGRSGDAAGALGAAVFEPFGAEKCRFCHVHGAIPSLGPPQRRTRRRGRPRRGAPGVRVYGGPLDAACSERAAFPAPLGGRERVDVFEAAQFSRACARTSAPP